MQADVAIIGGGPAGCAAALALLSRGHSVVVMAAPKHQQKPTETAVPALARLLISLGAAEALNACEPCYGILSAWGRNTLAFQPGILNPFGHAWFIHRARFDSCLQTTARDSGATWINEEAQSVNFDTNGASIATTGLPVRARWVAFATGSSTWPARVTQQTPSKMDSLIVFWARLQSQLSERLLFVEPAERGWWYLCPADGPGAIACFVTDPLSARSLSPSQPPAWNQLFQATRLSQQLQGEPHAEQIHVALTGLSALPEKHGTNWIAVGDAAAKLDPLGSSGTATAQRGRRELEDAPSFYPACGQPQWHGPDATLQHTWRQLIRLLLLARGEPIGEEALLQYQKKSLGAFSGHVCLTELSPLSTRNQTHWPYADHQGLPDWAESRAQFNAAFAAHRIATLREKIARHHPRAVVFYFWKHRQSAEAVAGGEFRSVIPEQLLGLERNGTAYFVTGHPAGRYPDTYFDGLGHYFHEHCRELFADQQASLLQKAIALAAAAHHWQKRKKGSPYILHPLRMACGLKTEAEQIVAVLHDVVEDTHWTFDDLRREGFPEDVLQALDCVTGRKGESYDDFLIRAASNPIARRVKLADLEDNMNVRDLPEVTPKDALRLSKYVKAWHRLSET